MAEAFAIGVPPWRLWDMTYREIDACFEGAVIRTRTTWKAHLWGAWQTANLNRAGKKFPDLKSLLRKLDPARIMGNVEMRQSLLAAARAMGAKVTIRKKGSPNVSGGGRPPG